MCIALSAVPSKGVEQQEEQHPEPNQNHRLPEQHQDRGSEGRSAQDAAGGPLRQGHRLQPVHIHAGPGLIQTGAGSCPPHHAVVDVKVTTLVCWMVFPPDWRGHHGRHA